MAAERPVFGTVFCAFGDFYIGYYRSKFEVQFINCEADDGIPSIKEI